MLAGHGNLRLVTNIPTEGGSGRKERGGEGKLPYCKDIYFSKRDCHFNLHCLLLMVQYAQGLVASPGYLAKPKQKVR